MDEYHVEYSDEQTKRVDRITTAAALIYAGTEQPARTTQEDLNHIISIAFQLEAKVTARIAAEGVQHE